MTARYLLTVTDEGAARLARWATGLRIAPANEWLSTAPVPVAGLDAVTRPALLADPRRLRLVLHTLAYAAHSHPDAEWPVLAAATVRYGAHWGDPVRPGEVEALRPLLADLLDPAGPQ